MRKKSHSSAALALAALFAASAPVAVSAQTVVFNETFGNSPTRTPSPFVPQFQGVGSGILASDMRAYYEFAQPGIGNNMYDVLLDGSYAVVNPQNLFNEGATGGWWRAAAPGGDDKRYRDHTGDEGAVMVVNAGKVKNDMYRRLVTLERGATYELSAWLLMVQIPGRTQFSLRETNDSAILGQSPLYTATPAEERNWVKRSWTFTVPSGCGQTDYSVAFSNMDPATAGNDLFIDDIVLQKVASNPNASQVLCTNPNIKVPKLTPGNDSAATPPNTMVPINVKGNDTVTPVGDNGVITGLPTPGSKKPENGTIVVRTDGTIEYTPNPGYDGTDKFTYEVCTVATPQYPTVSCAEAEVSVFVGTPTAIAKDDEATIPPGQPSITLNVTDNDTSSNPDRGPIDPTTITPLKNPSNGTVTYDPTGNALYTPTPGFVGTDTFTYQVCTKPEAGLKQTCDSANVTVHVPAEKLTVTPTPDKAATEVNRPVTIKILSNDESNDPVNAPLNKLATQVSGPANGRVTFAADGTAVYTPNTNYVGTDKFTYEVCTDAKNPPYTQAKVCETAEVTVDVLPKPQIHPGNDVVSILPGETVTINVRANDTATPTGDSTVQVGYPRQKAGTQPETPKATYSFDADGNIKYVPKSGASGVDTFVYTICTEPNDVHPQAVCGDATVTVYIGDPKVNAGDDTATTKVGQPVEIDLLANDKSSDESIATLVPNVTVTKQTDNGTVVIDPVTGKATFTPNPGFTGKNVFTYEVCNNWNPKSCESANATVYVAPDNLQVVAQPTSDVTRMNTPVNIPVISGNESSDPAKAPTNKTGKAVRTPANGVVSYNPNGTATYVPNPGYVGKDSFTYEVCTIKQEPYMVEVCEQAEVTVTVKSDNVTAVPDVRSLEQDQSVTIFVGQNDEHSAGTTLNPGSVRVTRQPAHGVISGPGVGGDLTYIPNEGYNGQDSFEYEICTNPIAPDNKVECDWAEVTLTVTPKPGTEVPGGTDPGTNPGTGPGNGGTDPGTNPGTGPGNGGTDPGTNPGTGPGNGGTDPGTNPGTGPGTPETPVASPVSVPANSTWALMLAALGIAGFAARRAQRARQ